LATGWTADELRAAPARLVRALSWRMFAARQWNAEVAAMAQQPVTHRSNFGSTAQWADAQRARTSAIKWVEDLSAILWPEGD
jgi:hypothetical protein